MKNMEKQTTTATPAAATAATALAATTCVEGAAMGGSKNIK